MTIRNRIQELRNVRAGDLQADPRNWRVHPKAQRDALSTMLSSIGYADALIARETPTGLVLIDGHLRADIDAEQVVPVLVTDLNEQEAGQLLATLDPLAAMAEADDKALSDLLSSLDVNDEIEKLLAGLHELPEFKEEPLGDPDAVVEPPAEATSKRGDVWLLGKHRLMCGDSTDADDVARLLDGAKPRLMVTDPPYGVNYDADWRNRDVGLGGFKGVIGARGVYPSNTGKVANDDKLDWGAAFNLSPSAVVYTWAASLYTGQTFVVLEAIGFEIRAQLIWRKQAISISRGHYHWQHEPCWYAVRKGQTAKWIGGRKQSTIWDIANLNPMGRSRDEVDKASGHSTQKPVECMERPIRNHEGDVYDPFVGSGTTIIAAERQSRTCYAMELEPRYVDAAVARWEAYTGRKAELAQ